MSAKTFTFLSDEKIADLVSTATRLAVYAAPSISLPAAGAFTERKLFNDSASLRIVVDADSEAFRMGFGDFKGLQGLIEDGIEVKDAPGLRIGVLIVDEKAWIFSPTPEIIFDQPDNNTINAVEVSRDFAQQIIVSVAPEILFAENALNAAVIPDSSEPEIGKLSVTSEAVERIDNELKDAPPQRFDAARQIRVYTNYFQFVEIKLHNCQLNSHRIQIPPDLLTLVSDPAVRERLTTSFRLVDEKSLLADELRGIKTAVDMLRADFTQTLGKSFGRILAKRYVAEFEKRKDAIEAIIKEASESCAKKLTGEVASNCENLAKVLLPALLENPSDAFRYATAGLDDDGKEKYLVRRIMPSDLGLARLADEMRLDVIFKDITIQMLKDEKFVKAVKERFPGIDEIHDERSAIDEKRHLP